MSRLQGQALTGRSYGVTRNHATSIARGQLQAKELQPMTSQERDSLILSYLQHVNGLVHTYAASTGFSYDDLHQEASIVIMRVLDRKPDEAQELHSYITTSVKHRFIDLIRYHQRRQTASLDAPTGHDHDRPNLAELLPARDQADPLTTLVARELLEELAAQPGKARRAAQLAELLALTEVQPC